MNNELLRRNESEVLAAVTHSADSILSEAISAVQGMMTNRTASQGAVMRKQTPLEANVRHDKGNIHI